MELLQPTNSGPRLSLKAVDWYRQELWFLHSKCTLNKECIGTLEEAIHLWQLDHQTNRRILSKEITFYTGLIEKSRTARQIRMLLVMAFFCQFQEIFFILYERWTSFWHKYQKFFLNLVEKCPKWRSFRFVLLFQFVFPNSKYLVLIIFCQTLITSNRNNFLCR